MKMIPISAIKILELLLHPPKGAVGMANSFLRFLMVPAGCWTYVQRPIDFFVSWLKKYYIFIIISKE
jgi:hypothetical protein